MHSTALHCRVLIHLLARWAYVNMELQVCGAEHVAWPERQSTVAQIGWQIQMSKLSSTSKEEAAWAAWFPSSAFALIGGRKGANLILKIRNGLALSSVHWWTQKNLTAFIQSRLLRPKSDWTAVLQIRSQNIFEFRVFQFELGKYVMQRPGDPNLEIILT